MKHILLSTNCTKRINEIHYKELKFFKSLGYRVSVVAEQDSHLIQNKEYIDQFIDISINPHSINPLNNFILIFKYLYNYNKLSPDIILHSTIKPNIFGSIASRFLGIQSFSIISGLGSTFQKKYFFNLFIKILYKMSQKKVQKVLFQNKEDLNYFVSNNFINGSKAEIMPTGVDLSKFDYRKFKVSKDSDVFNFLYVGRLHVDKGFFEYISASKKMSTINDNIFFHIVGDFSSKKDKSIHAENLNFKNSVYHGYKNDIRDILINADCVVMPSKREGMSNILLESGSFAKLSITTNVPGCKEIISNNYNGFIIQNVDTQLLFQAMKNVYFLDKNKKAKMGKNALRNIENNFNYESVKQFYIKLLSH